MEFLLDVFETIIWVIFVIWLLRRIFGRRPARPASTGRVERQPAAPMKTLHRDPSCGTYVAEDISYPLEEDGKTLHFCSEECRARYVARKRRSAQA